MKATIAWLNAAIAGKELSAGMTYYKVNDDTISATDGKLTACAPWPYGGKFFVPGAEFEKVLKRMSGEPKITEAEGCIKIKSGRFSGTIQTLPLTEWGYPGIEKADWQKIPKGLLPLLAALRPFVSENEQPAWGRCVALEDGWAYATNNMTIAGAACKELGAVKALLPAEALDFILGRVDGLSEWTGDDNFIAFRWANGAWMRTQLVVGQFPEKAAALVKGAWKQKPTQKVSDEFKEALERVSELAEDTVLIYADRLEARFDKAVVEDGVKCEVPKGVKCSIWGAKFLLPALQAADAWAPAVWPSPAPFKGPLVAGYIVGRRQ